MMNMQLNLETGQLNLQRTCKLLRLYLSWPGRLESLGELEAERFLAWLESAYSHLSVVRTLNGIDSIYEFFDLNPDVIDACRYLKTSEQKTSSSARQDQRISTTTQAFLVVYECDSNPELVGLSFKGTVLDVAKKGVGIESNYAVPSGSILSMTIVQPGIPMKLYYLSGEVRWLSGVGMTHQMGVKMFEMEDYDKWESDFYEQVVINSSISGHSS